jgi:hypothetical protein
MRFTRNQEIKLETSIENNIFDYEGTQSKEFATVRLLTTVHNPRNPFITYWEVLYLDETGMHEEHETRVYSEQTLSRYKVLTGDIGISVS